MGIIEYFRHATVSALAIVLIFAGLKAHGEAGNSDGGERRPPPPPSREERGERGSLGRGGEGGKIGGGRRRGDSPRDFPMINRLLESLPENEQAKLEKMREENPAQFREELRRRIAGKHGGFGNGAHGREYEQLRSLATEYRNTGSEQRREELRGEIRSIVRGGFDRGMEMSRQHLRELEERVEGLRAKIEERQARADEFINSRLEKILEDGGKD